MIRVAHPLDIPRILNLAEGYNEEARQVNHFITTWDAELTVCNLLSTLNSESGLLIVSVEAGKVVGFLWAVACCPVPWSSHRSADCFMFYVHPDYRGSLHAIRLIKAFKVWAVTVDCVEIRISTASGLNTERVEALFSRLGYKPLGNTYHQLIT